MTNEINAAWIGLIGAIVGGGITSFTTWVIAYGERSRFARERLWDLRREAYTAIIAATVEALRSAKVWDDEYQRDHRIFNKTERGRWLSDKAFEKFTEAGEVIAHRLLLGKEFHDRFDRMVVEVGGLYDQLIEDRSAKLRACLKSGQRDLLAIGLKEMPKRSVK